MFALNIIIYIMIKNYFLLCINKAWYKSLSFADFFMNQKIISFCELHFNNCQPLHEVLKQKLLEWKSPAIRVFFFTPSGLIFGNLIKKVHITDALFTSYTRTMINMKIYKLRLGSVATRSLVSLPARQFKQSRNRKKMKLLNMSIFPGKVKNDHLSRNRIISIFPRKSIMSIFPGNVKWVSIQERYNDFLSRKGKNKHLSREGKN